MDPKLHPHRRFRVRLSTLLPGREPDLRIAVRVAQNGRTIWIVDAHPDGTRFLVRADEILTGFLELAWPIRLDAKGDTQIVFPEEN